MDTSPTQMANIQYLKDITALKEEVEKWEADDENLTKVMSMVSKELGDDEEPWVAVDDIYDIVKKLKKEIEKLKEELDVWVNPKGEVVMNREGVMLYEATQEENEKLKKEVEELNEYQSEVDSMENTLLEILENGKIKDEFGDIYDADGEVRYYDVPDIIKKLQKEVEELKESCDNLNNAAASANADYEKLVDKNNNDNLNFGDIYKEREEEIKKLKEENKKLKEDNDYLREEDAGWCAVKKLKEEIEELKEKNANNKRFTDNAITTLLHKGWTKGDCGVWCEPKSQPRDEEDNDGYRKEVAELKEKVEKQDEIILIKDHEYDELKKEIVEALGGKKVFEPYPDDIKLRDITGAIRSLVSKDSYDPETGDISKKKWRVYCVDGNDEEFFESRKEAEDYIDELNKEGFSGCKMTANAVLSYKTIDYDWYGVDEEKFCADCDKPHNCEDCVKKAGMKGAWLARMDC